MAAPIEFDLSLVNPGERFQFWHDVGSLVHRPLQPIVQQQSDLMVRAQMSLLGEAVLGKMTATTQWFERTENMIRRDQVDSFILVLLKAGSMHWTGTNREIAVKTGDLLLLDNHEPCRSEWSRHQQVYAVLPRDLLKATGWRDPQTAILRSTDPRAKVLGQHLSAIWRDQESGSTEAETALGLGLAVLTSVYFNSTGARENNISEAGINAISEALITWISRNLRNPNLDANLIASTFHISRSTLYDFFKPWGGVRTYIQRRRLEQARQILESAERRLSITQLATELGFRSLSSFSRAFSDQWGISPKEAQKQALVQADCTIKSTMSEKESSSDEGKRKQLEVKTKQYYRAVMSMRSTRPAARPQTLRQR